MSASSSLSRQVKSCEMHVSVAQASETMKQLAKQTLARHHQMSASAVEGSGGSYDRESSPSEAGINNSGDVGDASQQLSASLGRDAAQMSLIGKLQRLEMERRLMSEEISDLGEQLQLAKSLAAQVKCVLRTHSVWLSVFGVAAW